MLKCDANVKTQLWFTINLHYAAYNLITIFCYTVYDGIICMSKSSSFWETNNTIKLFEKIMIH